MAAPSSCAPYRDPSRPIWFAGAAVIVLGATLLLSIIPVQGPPCLFKAAVGLPCPGCGLTRSLVALWHGRIALSFRYHPLGLPLALLCLILIWIPTRRAAVAEQISAWLFQPRLVSIACAALAGVWITRIAFALAGSRFFLW